MINLKKLLANETAKKTITEQSIGAYIGMVKNELKQINEKVQAGALNKFTEAIPLLRLQTMLQQVNNAIASGTVPEIAKPEITKPASTDLDSNNNGYPDKGENPELERALRGYGQKNYQGD